MTKEEKVHDISDLAKRAREVVDQIISDDTAISFTPHGNIGVLVVYCAWQAHLAKSGIFVYKTSATHDCYKIAGDAVMEVTTGALSGTTGTDTKFTVSANSADGKIYLENRTGANQRFRAIELHG